jgi:hypothetical protein
MEGFSFVTPVTGLNRPNTGKEDYDDDDDDYHSTGAAYSYVIWAMTNKPVRGCSSET